ncbi:MAG TPA: G/U mismatch-specific DNA glycosylase [Phycisphaerae bacterium]
MNSQGLNVSNYSPDILSKNLDVIFCGINPAMTAATAGHNFSSPSNRFWSVLHLAGFTDHRINPADERHILKYRCGITAVVERPTRQASEVTTDEFRTVRPAFDAKIRRLAPRSVAFLGKRAYSAMMGQPIKAWGRQPAEFGKAAVWVLPNPSGLNRSFTLGALVKAYAELRVWHEQTFI